MSASRQTKYAMANAGLGVLLYLAFRFYTSINAQPLRHHGQVRKDILAAVVLYIVAGIVIAIRAYYRSIRDNTLDQSEAAAGLLAYGALSADRMKKITMNLEVDGQEYVILEKQGTLTLSPERFNMPIHSGDSVNVQLSTDKSTQLIPTLVTRIDGVNQQVILKRK